MEYDTDRIVTHPGKPHKDDFLTVCLLLAMYPKAPVLRREPTEHDLTHTGTWVVDTGKKYEPEFRNFDHHQLPADAPPTCALQMVMEHVFGRETAHSTFKWLLPTSILDSKGPGPAAEYYRVTRDQLTDMMSPVERMFLEVFGEFEYFGHDHWLAIAMRSIGERMLNRVKGLEAAHAGIKTEVLSIDNIPVMITDAASVDALPAEYRCYMNEVQDARRGQLTSVGVDLAASISPNVDSRGPAWTLYRYDDDPRIDFNALVLQREPEVVYVSKVEFVHANGFLAKVSADATVEELVERIRVSITHP